MSASDRCTYNVSVHLVFQAEDGIRDPVVTGVQTCALPIWAGPVLGLLEDPSGAPLGEHLALEPRKRIPTGNVREAVAAVVAHGAGIVPSRPGGSAGRVRQAAADRGSGRGPCRPPRA